MKNLNLSDENEEERMGYATALLNYTVAQQHRTTFPSLIAQSHTTRGFARATPSYDNLKTKHHVGGFLFRSNQRVMVCGANAGRKSLKQILRDVNVSINMQGLP